MPYSSFQKLGWLKKRLMLDAATLILRDECLALASWIQASPGDMKSAMRENYNVWSIDDERVVADWSEKLGGFQSER